MTQAREPWEEPARRAQPGDPGASAAPKRAADFDEPEQISFQRFDDPEAFVETRMIPRIVWDPQLDHSAPSRRAEPPPAEPAAASGAADSGQDLVDRGDGAGQQLDDSAESIVDAIDEQDRKHLGRNSLLMASGTLVSRVLGMVNASLQTAVLGTAVAGAAFKSANTLPNFILVLLSAGILQAVLIPQITKAMKRPDGGQDFVDRLVTAALVLIAAVAIICTAGAALLMRSFTSLSGPGMQLTIAFAYICMPQVLFYGIFAVLGNILNARGRFGAYGWAPVANNVVAIAGLVVFLALWGSQKEAAAWTPQMIWVLAGSATLGIAVQAALLIPPLYRSGFRWRPRWGLRGHGFGQLGRFASLTFLALVIAQGGGLLTMKVATYLADSADAQGIEVASYVSYQNAMSLFQMPYALIAMSLLTALFPQLARAWQRRDDPRTGLADMREMVRRGLTLPALGIIPVSMLFIALAMPAVRVVYFSLTAEQARATTLPLIVMCASMLSFTIVTLQQQYCFASEQGKTNLWMQCLLTAIQVGFALLAYLVPLEDGLVVICLGMFFGNTTLAIVFMLYARHQIGDFGLGSILGMYLRLGIASAVSGVAAWLAYRGVLMLMPPAIAAETAFGDAESFNASVWLWQLLGGVAGGVSFIVAILITARLFGVREFFDLVNPLLRRLHLPQVR